MPTKRSFKPKEDPPLGSEPLRKSLGMVWEQGCSLNPSAQLQDAVVADENWRGLASGAERRKLQNRLNKRASRRRKLGIETNELNGLSAKQKWIIYTEPAQAEGQFYLNPDHQTELTSSSNVVTKFPTEASFHLCELADDDRARVLRRLQDRVYSSTTRTPLSSDLLFSITQFNIISALCKNATCLGLTLQLLHLDNPSRFNMLQPDASFILPPSLQPTRLQREIIHHPWIDLFPVLSIRHMLLQKMGRYDKAEICRDFFGECGAQAGSVGLLVWGEAWDPSSYEISEWFLRKWGWMMEDCSDIIQSTNFWRASRGEKPLRLTSN